MMYIVMIALAIMPLIIVFSFLMAILNYQREVPKGSTKINFKILKLMDLNIHIKTERTTYNKKKSK